MQWEGIQQPIMIILKMGEDANLVLMMMLSLLIGINMIMVLLYSMVISCISRKSIYGVTQFFVFPHPRIRNPNVCS